MQTIRGRIATTHVHFNLAVYQVVTITVCEVDGHGWRVVCSWVCPVVVVVFGGGDDVFVCLLRERPITNGLGVAVLSCVCTFVQDTQERRLCEPMTRRLTTLTRFSS